MGLNVQLLWAAMQTDPEAARVVFEAGVPLTMIPLEVRICPKQPASEVPNEGNECLVRMVSICKATGLLGFTGGQLSS